MISSGSAVSLNPSVGKSAIMGRFGVVTSALFLTGILWVTCTNGRAFEGELDKKGRNIFSESSSFVKGSSEDGKETALTQNVDFEKVDQVDVDLEDEALTEEGKITIGDMVLTPKYSTDHSRNGSHVSKRAYEINVQERLWPKGIVYYSFGKKFRQNHKQYIEKAFNEYQTTTCLKFQKKSQGQRIIIKSNTKLCSSQIGMDDQPQELHLSANGCLMFHDTVLHELGHALGLFHEHVRMDRDNYVTINYKNIKPGNVINDEFKIVNSKQLTTLNIPYDYYSIMHYGLKTFSKNNKETITPKDPTVRAAMEKKKNLSFRDVKGLNLLYKCRGKEKKGCKLQDTDCPGEGFVDKNCQCMCDIFGLDKHPAKCDYDICSKHNDLVVGNTNVSIYVGAKTYEDALKTCKNKKMVLSVLGGTTWTKQLVNERCHAHRNHTKLWIFGTIPNQNSCAQLHIIKDGKGGYQFRTLFTDCNALADGFLCRDSTECTGSYSGYIGLGKASIYDGPHTYIEALRTCQASNGQLPIDINIGNYLNLAAGCAPRESLTKLWIGRVYNGPCRQLAIFPQRGRYAVRFENANCNDYADGYICQAYSGWNQG